MEQYMTYYIMVVAAIGFFFFKVLPFLRKAKKVMNAFKGTQFKKDSNLSSEQQKQIATSAIYSAQQAAYVNALETGLGKSEVKEILEEWWGINNQTDAVDTLEYLKEGGFQACLPIAYQAIAQKDIPFNEFLQQNINDYEDLQTIQERTYNLKTNLGQISEIKVIQNIEDIQKLGAAGWDAGRLGFITRLCFDMDYITEQQAWQYLADAHKMAKQYFNNWEDFSKSYVIGRAMWNGANNDGMYAIARDLLDEKPSPYDAGF